MDESMKICENCVHSQPLSATDACFCEKKGIVKASGACGKYKLDLLKYKPGRPISIKSIAKELES